MSRLALLSLAAIAAGCASTPAAPEPPFLDAIPRTVAPAPGHPSDEPVVLPFEAPAGLAVEFRATADGPPPTLCLAAAEGWARYLAGEGESDPTDLAGDALACSAPDTAASVVREVLPRAGRYVVVAAGTRGRAPGPFTLEPTPGPTPTLLVPGTPTTDTLAAGAPAQATYAVDGRAGQWLTVTAASGTFAPYVELGAWVGPAYTPLVGDGAATGDTAVVSVVLPADGRYTVRVRGGDRGDAFTVEASNPPPAASASGGDPADRYALIVSVADYPGLGPDQPGDLVGPTADGAAVQKLLVEDYGFRPENVRVLRDAEATREAVVEAFRTHLGQAGPEGTAVFHYAGHGTQLPAEVLPTGFAATLAEDDALDEALVLWGRGGDYSYLLDHELGALAEGLSAGHAVVVLDNCHSGDGTRQERGGRVSSALRILPYDQMAGRIDRPDDLLGPRGTAGAERHVLLAAARDEQPSLELDRLAPDGGRAGVFTTALVRALREAGPETTFADVVASLRPLVGRMTGTEMARYGYRPQEPQVEGAQANARVREALGR